MCVYRKCEVKTTTCPFRGPTGSILEPLLFRCYINDLADQISYSSVFMFEDDAELQKNYMHR